MADKLSKAARSDNMRRIRSKNTKPELLVRSFLHSRGLRFRVHVSNLPGKPDLVFPSRRLCLFVHGCFWHGCERCVDGTRSVKSNAEYWAAKVQNNIARDKKNIAALHDAGWQVMELWECDVVKVSTLRSVANKIGKIKSR